MDLQTPASALNDGIQRVSGAFRPVFVAEEGSGGRKATGTAFVVGENNRRFLLTAEHVVKGPHKKFVGVIGEDTFPWPRNYSKLAAKQEGLPDADIAWASATVTQSDTALRDHLPFALARAAIPDEDGAVYVAVGFPVSKAKIRLGEGIAAAKLMTAVVHRAPSEVLNDLSLDPRIQIAMAYSQDGRTNLDGSSAKGAHPQGMSGGALFALMSTQSENKTVVIPFLIGILTQYHIDINALVATRVAHFWNAIPEHGVSQPLYSRVDA
jgi:hypothetical protein